MLITWKTCFETPQEAPLVSWILDTNSICAFRYHSCSRFSLLVRNSSTSSIFDDLWSRQHTELSASNMRAVIYIRAVISGLRRFSRIKRILGLTYLLFQMLLACNTQSGKQLRTRQQRGGFLMIWGFISFYGVSKFLLIRSSQNSDRYLEVLQNRLLLFAALVFW